MTKALGLLLVIAIGAPQAAHALERDDTMMDWLHASDADRSRLLDELQAKDSKLHQAHRAEMMDCMNGAAEIAGHSSLRIGDVAEACSDSLSPPTGKAPTET